MTKFRLYLVPDASSAVSISFFGEGDSFSSEVSVEFLCSSDSPTETPLLSFARSVGCVVIKTPVSTALGEGDSLSVSVVDSVAGLSSATLVKLMLLDESDTLTSKIRLNLKVCTFLTTIVSLQNMKRMMMVVVVVAVVAASEGWSSSLSS